MKKTLTPEIIRAGYDHCVSRCQDIGCRECPLAQARNCIAWTRVSAVREWHDTANKAAIIKAAVERYCDPLYVDLLKVKELSDGKETDNNT